MGIPRWLYSSHEDEVLRLRSWGSRRTGLNVMCLDSRRGGPAVWMVALAGLCLTIGPEDGVDEGLASVLDEHPRTRHHTWRFRSGRALQLSYTPKPREARG